MGGLLSRFFQVPLCFVLQLNEPAEDWRLWELRGYFKPDIIKKEFELPGNLEPINILAIGYSNEEAAVYCN